VLNNMSIRSLISPAFTLIELLLVVAILGIIIAFGAPFFGGAFSRTNIDNANLLTAQSLRRAMLKAQSNEMDSDWGVKLSSGQILIFKGSSYAARDAGFDIITELEDNVVFSGDTEIVFPKHSGELSSNKSVTIGLANTSESKTITINTKGALSY